jgi:hypothetical protein
MASAANTSADERRSGLLSRDQFRDGVFGRDNHSCVICGAEGKLDAHHIMDRRLWHDGGYYLDNGVSLCEPHHLQAEQTVISCEDLRVAAGITRIILPEHLEAGEVYDKWADVQLSDGRRLQGELFNDDSVQKILQAGDMLRLFTPYVKYPRTYHLPSSPGAGADDKTLRDLSQFEDREIVVTCKLDGENASVYPDGFFHARSLDGRSHPSQAWVKALAARIGPELPSGWRVCGENLYAQHSIRYENLPSYFLMFAIYDEHNLCLSWDDTEEWAALLGLQTTPVIYRGRLDSEVVQRAFQKYADSHDGEHEGYVIRLAESFPYSAHRVSTGKWVRADHVADRVHHWASTQVKPNQLSG